MSKRSKIQQLEQLDSIKPLARTIDTFYQTRAKTVGKSKFEALSKVVPILAEVAKTGYNHRAGEEKRRITQEFVKNPAQFVNKVKAGEFSEMTSAAQMLSGEYIGKKLARFYGSDLNQEYNQSPDMANSQNENDFFKFESHFRPRYVEANKELFQLPGVSEGFAGTFRQYLSSLDASHVALAKKNRIKTQTEGFGESLVSSMDAFSRGLIDDEQFAAKVRSDQADFNVAFGYDNSRANEATLDAITKYVTSGAVEPSVGRKILQAAKKVPTSKGNTLFSTLKGRTGFGKAMAKIDDMEDKQQRTEIAYFNHERSVTTDWGQGTIINAVAANLGNLENLELETVFNSEQLQKLENYYPQFRKFFEQQIDYFSQKGEEVPVEEVYQMMMEISEAGGGEQGKGLLNQFVQEGRIKNNMPVFNKLWGLTQQSKDAKEPQWHLDPMYRRYYSFLSGQSMDNGELILFAPTSNNTQALQMFTETFIQDIFFSPKYQNGSQIEKLHLIKPLYKETLDFLKGKSENPPVQIQTLDAEKE